MVLPETFTHFARTAAEQLRWKAARPLVEDELLTHLCDQRDALMAGGMDEAAAAAESLRLTGDPYEIGTALDRVHRPKTPKLLFALAALIALAGLAFTALVSFRDYELSYFAVHQSVALLLGTAGMLEGCYYFDDYIARLHDHYLYLARKYGIVPMRAGEWARAGIRAQNRPVTRIVQLASFVARNDFIFDRVAGCRTREDVHALFDTEVSGYWATHYVPDGSGERCPRRIGAEKADLLAINAVVPVMFAYGQTTGKGALKDAAFDLLGDIPAENNAIVRSWSGMGVPVRSALDSQALLQLRNEYCTQGRCTDCKVGKSIIKVRDKAFSFR